MIPAVVTARAARPGGRPGLRSSPPSGLAVALALLLAACSGGASLPADDGAAAAGGGGGPVSGGSAGGGAASGAGLDANLAEAPAGAPTGDVPSTVAASRLDPADVEAARMLTRATFGPTMASIAEYRTYPDAASWIDAQMALPASLVSPYTRANSNGSNPEARHEAWWNNALAGDDQLRQRVAFALSQLFVVSDVDAALANAQYGIADYYDMLAGSAFGNYRELLEDVALHPVMGVYLSMVLNERADEATNVRPDENFAREVLQLFSIGLHELDASARPVPAGNPTPAYTQRTVEEFARVFTGWNYPAARRWNDTNISARNYEGPMEPNEAFHDAGAKTLLNGAVAPAGLTARQDLEFALDNIANHPNVGPFISKQLIQRLVTSNPSPEYVARVSGTFDDDGAGTRGNLGAVVRAILLDPEARTGHLENPDFGKLREPVVRMVHLWRALDAVPGPEANGVHRTADFAVHRIDEAVGQGGPARQLGVQLLPARQHHRARRRAAVPGDADHVGGQPRGHAQQPAPPVLSLHDALGPVRRQLARDPGGPGAAGRARGGCRCAARSLQPAVRRREHARRRARHPRRSPLALRRRRRLALRGRAGHDVHAVGVADVHPAALRQTRIPTMRFTSTKATGVDRERRRLLGSLAALPLLPGVSMLADTAAAQSAGGAAGACGDARTIVCLFLAGGADSFNMFVPGGRAYDEYRATRSDLAVAESDLLGVSDASQGGFGFNAALPTFARLYGEGRLSVGEQRRALDPAHDALGLPGFRRAAAVAVRAQHPAEAVADGRRHRVRQHRVRLGRRDGRARGRVQRHAARSRRRTRSPAARTGWPRRAPTTSA